MKKAIIFLMSLIFISCGRNKEEQMLYDYQAIGVKKIFNTSLEELDFKINSIEEKGVVTSKDSISYFKNKLIKLWLGQDAKQSEIDTLSYDYVISKLDKTAKTYQEIIVLNIKAGKKYKNYDNKKKRDQYIDATSDVKNWKSLSDIYSLNTDSILSVKYAVNYSTVNPVMKVKQTFTKTYFTDANQTKFIHEEEIE